VIVLVAFSCAELRRAPGASGCACVLPFTQSGRLVVLLRNAILIVAAGFGAANGLAFSSPAIAAGVLAAAALVVGEVAADAVSARNATYGRG
jgi:type III secretory pathway component EscT